MATRSSIGKAGCRNPGSPGLDINACPARPPAAESECYVGEQQDRALLDRIAAERAPERADVIIDDAAHVGQLARISFWHLFERHLKPGGYYFIQDWGTGYWSQYPDGKHFSPEPAELSWHERFLDQLHKSSGVQGVYSLRKLTGWMRWNLVRRRFHGHDRGMVGFVQGADRRMRGRGHDPSRPWNRRARDARCLKWMRVSLGHVVIRKARRLDA